MMHELLCCLLQPGLVSAVVLLHAPGLSVAAIMQVGRANVDPLVLLSVYVITAAVLAAILEKRNVRDAGLAL